MGAWVFENSIVSVFLVTVHHRDRIEGCLHLCSVYQGNYLNLCQSYLDSSSILRLSRSSNTIPCILRNSSAIASHFSRMRNANPSYALHCQRLVYNWGAPPLKLAECPQLLAAPSRRQRANNCTIMTRGIGSGRGYLHIQKHSNKIFYCSRSRFLREIL